MNAGPFGSDDERGNLPNPRPAPGRRDDSAIPDWAKITADIASTSDEDTESFDTVVPEEKKSVVQPQSPYGGAPVDLSALSDEEPDDFSTPTNQSAPAYRSVEELERAAQSEQTEYWGEPETAPQPANALNETAEETYAQPVSEPAVEEKPAKIKPKRYTTMKKALAKLPASQYQLPPEDGTKAKGRGFAGGRWKVLALRIGVWSSFGMILLVGLFAMFGPRGPSLNAVTNNVLAEINRNAFPLEEGEQLASRFITAYLTYEPNDLDTRNEELRGYIVGSSGGAQSNITDIDPLRSQLVVDGPYLAKPAELVTDNHVVYTFAVKVENPAYVATDPENPSIVTILDALPARWIYISVPMVADAEGHIGVAAKPALVPQPPVADGVDRIGIQVDRDATLDAESPMEEFFKHWADSYFEGMRPYLVAGSSTEAAQLGLQGTAEFVSLQVLEVERLPDDYEPDPEETLTCTGPDYDAPCRNAFATVSWSLPDGSELIQEYRMIIFNDGQNWRVIDIRGGKFDAVGR